MAIVSSIVCTLGIFNSFCLTSASKDVTLKTFESNVLSINPVDGTKIVFSRGDVMFKNAADITVFKTSDNDLTEYLGMREQDICVLEMKNNVTDFDTWIWNNAFDDDEPVDMDTIFAEATLKEFKQSGEMNHPLQLVEKQDIFEHDLNIIVFFKNASNAIKMSQMVRNIDANISKSCWDVLQSDPPSSVIKIPSIGITSPKIFGNKHVSILAVPLSNYSLNVFVNANIKELEMNNK